MERLRIVLAGLLMAPLAAACGDDGGMTTDPDAGGEDAGMMTDAMPDEDSGTGGDMRTLTLDFTGLAPVGEDLVYEGWLIVDETPVTTGRFNLDESGAPDPATFEVSAEDAGAASAFVLTIEPATGDDPAPSATHVLAGALSDGTADLVASATPAIGTDFADAAGSYVLNTPSSGDVSEDYDQGIWWLDPSGGSPAAALDLPEAPEGWVYEGWVVDMSGDEPMPITTGRFTAVDEADSDGGGPDAGDDGTPPFPGQDFIDPAKILASGDWAAVITLEPDLEGDSPAPYGIKPLVDPTIEDVMPPDTQDMMNMAADTLPTGSATLSGGS